MMLIQRILSAVSHRANRHSDSQSEGHRSLISTDDQDTDITAPKQKSPQNYYHHLQKEEVMPSYNTRAVHESKKALGFREAPNTWTETPVDTTDKCNKIFTSKWLSDDKVIFGSKDNKLMLLHCEKRKKVELSEIELPNLQNGEEEGMSQSRSSCGMHDIAVNSTKKLVATGGAKTNEICLFSYENKHMNLELHPMRILKDHKDWVSGLDWFDNETLVSGGKDGRLNVWKPSHFSVTPSHTHIMNDNIPGVRALRTDVYNDSVVSLCMNGTVKIWDINKCRDTWNTTLKYQKEAVCLCVNEERGQIIIGSQKHITVLDPRCAQHNFFKSGKNKYIESLDKGWGVRSVSVEQNVITIGGGVGKLSFYDLRAGDYLVYDEKECIGVQTGWRRRDSIYQNIFVENHLPTPTAIYTHCYSPNENKLFVAGGPTPFGLFGSFVSVFS